MNFDLSLWPIVYITLFYFSITATVLYSGLFLEVRDWWWGTLCDSDIWILRKAAFLAVCPLCLGTDIAFFGNAFFFNILYWSDFINWTDTIVLSFAQGGVIWILASITNYFAHAKYTQEVTAKLMQKELDYEIKT